MPDLQAIALDILSIPATNAGVERMLSQMQLHTEGRRSSIKEDLLDARVILAMNKHMH